jgi:uncharacterized protein (TIGR02145 family)
MKKRNNFCVFCTIIMAFSFLLITSCKKDNPALPSAQKNYITDIDANEYNTVFIGSQTWLAENLKVTKFNDGTAIPLVEDSLAWSVLKSAGYCTSTQQSLNTYGAMYNWYAVTSGKLCPQGWHVPSDDEWTELTTFLGGENIAGGKLKEFGPIHWLSPNTDATNETGFNALPGAGRYFDGTFWGIGQFGNWWSSTEKSTGIAWLRNLHSSDGGLYRDNWPEGSGFSVRCIKN